VTGNIADLVAAYRTSDDAAGPSTTRALLGEAFGSREARDVCAVLDRLPLIEISASASVVSSQPMSSKNTKSPSGADAGVHEGAECSDSSIALEVTLTRAQNTGQNFGSTGTHRRRIHRGSTTAPRVYAPRFPKLKNEGWWLLVEDVSVSGGEVLAMKRVASLRQQSKVNLVVPHRVGSVVLHLICDSYIGLDKVHTISVPSF